MKKISILPLITLFLVSLIAACSPKYYLMKDVPFGIQKQPKEKARVVFIRPQSGGLSGSGLGYMPVYDGDVLIGILGKDSYFTYDAEPGEYVFGASFCQGIDFVKANIEGGRTYCIQYRK